METTPSEKEEEMLRRLNVDDLPQAGPLVKVVYLNHFTTSFDITDQQGGRITCNWSANYGVSNRFYYMAESVFAMRLVNLRSVAYYTDQNF